MLLKQRFDSQESLPREATFYTHTVASKRPNDICTVRFFFYTNGPEANISSLNFYVHPKPINSQMLSTPLFQATGNSEQRWKKGTAQFTSVTPFQFAFRGVQSALGPILAIDDISFDMSKCVMVDNVATSSASTSSATSTSSDRILSTLSPNHETTSTSSYNNKLPSHHKEPWLAVAIVVPIIIVLGSIAGFFAWHRYQHQKALMSDDHLTLRMSAVQLSLRR